MKYGTAFGTTRPEERVSALHQFTNMLPHWEGSSRRMINSRTKKIHGSARVRNLLNVASSECFR